MIKWMQIRSFRCRSLVIHAIAFLTFVIVTFYYTISKEYSLSDFSFICQNLIGLRDESNLQIFYNSTCSLASDKRGPHQKVIAYSLYGNFSQEHIYKKYLDPLVETIRIIPLIYPGWLVRIYHNFTIADVGIHRWGFFKNMFSGESHVDFCNVTEIIKNRNLGDIFAMTWRWLPLLDNLVDALMSRDSDSRIVSREEEAVSEWLASDKIFHLMRDHPAHCLFGPILGDIFVNLPAPKHCV